MCRRLSPSRPRLGAPSTSWFFHELYLYVLFYYVYTHMKRHLFSRAVFMQRVIRLYGCPWLHGFFLVVLSSPGFQVARITACLHHSRSRQTRCPVSKAWKKKSAPREFLLTTEAELWSNRTTTTYQLVLKPASSPA